jgi:ketopantoate reductase
VIKSKRLLLAMADVDMYEESDYASGDSYDSESDFDDEENVVVASNKSKTKALVPQKRSVLTPSKNVGNVPKKTKNEKTIEERYQKKTQLEHILLRPDTYSKYQESHTFILFVATTDC